MANRQPDEVATDWMINYVLDWEVFGEYELSKLMLDIHRGMISFFTTDTTDITEFVIKVSATQDGQVATPEFVKKSTASFIDLKQAFNVAIDATDPELFWRGRSAIQRAKLDSSWVTRNRQSSTRVASLLEKQKDYIAAWGHGSVEALLGAIYQLDEGDTNVNVEKKVYICQEVMDDYLEKGAYTQNIVTRIKTGNIVFGYDSGQWKAQMLPLHYSYIGWVYLFMLLSGYYLEMPWKDSGLNEGNMLSPVSDQAPHNLKRNIVKELLNALGWNINEAVRNMLANVPADIELPETGSKAYDDLALIDSVENPLGNGTTHPAVKEEWALVPAGMDPALNSPVVQQPFVQLVIQNNQGIENQAVSLKRMAIQRCQGMLDFARNVIDTAAGPETLNVEDHEPTLFEPDITALKTPQAGTGEASVIATTQQSVFDTQITDEEFFQSLQHQVRLEADVDSPVGLLTKASGMINLYSLNAVTNAMKLAKYGGCAYYWSHPGFHQHQKRGQQWPV
ncbi:hypothetical protein SPFM10_00027 [Salmonella phage SPFM10]|nr:hypothetical protein SPFM10_00027 [Salmonella phage SPFM10]